MHFLSLSSPSLKLSALLSSASDEKYKREHFNILNIESGSRGFLMTRIAEVDAVQCVSASSITQVLCSMTILKTV